MSWLLMEKLLRHQQSVRSSEGCCVDRLNSPGQSGHRADIPNRSFMTLNVTSGRNFAATQHGQHAAIPTYNQCAMKTGSVALAKMWRVAPPKIYCLKRLCV